MENGNVANLLESFQRTMNRPAWRPGTTALALMGLGLFACGLLVFDALAARISACIGGGLIALWVNGMEIANPLTKAMQKQAKQKSGVVTIPDGYELTPKAPKVVE